MRQFALTWSGARTEFDILKLNLGVEVRDRTYRHRTGGGTPGKIVSSPLVLLRGKKGAALGFRHALSDGLILSRCGVYGNVVRILAPLTIRFEVLEEGANILSGSILKALSDAEL